MSRLDISQFVTFSSSSTHSYGCKLIHRYSCHNSSHQFYFTRLPRLWNKLSGLVDLLNCLFTVAKKQLHQLMWSSFISHFNQDDICTFHFHFHTTNVLWRKLICQFFSNLFLSYPLPSSFTGSLCESHSQHQCCSIKITQFVL